MKKLYRCQSVTLFLGHPVYMTYSLPNSKTYSDPRRHFLLMADNPVIIQHDSLPEFSRSVVAL